ncbi:MAG TPA: HNH endonuclease signature motif containing protein [Kofleriaceae bacterium]|nr:HNH endonuclease signature motif containing protein [Kofleriaceae bacterium]
MSRSYVAKALREEIAKDARRRCGYCLTSARIIGAPMEIEHIIPESLGGPTVRENLWLACSMCNDHKGNRIAGPDPQTGEVVRLFDPRRQVWAEHFGWNTGGDMIIGKTATGRATVAAIRLNRAELVEARRGWIIAGWHPPKD